jgi:hypothetical protein
MLGWRNRQWQQQGGSEAGDLMTEHRVTGGRAGGLAITAALLLLLAQSAGGGGCAKRPPGPTQSHPVSQRPTVETDPDRRAANLQQQAQAFVALSKDLPGMTPAENRRLNQQVFTQLAQILPALGGPDAGGIFEHQVSVVNDTRTQLAGRSTDLATDPIVDNGLRAVRNALTELAHGAYYDQPQVGQSVDQLSAKVEELDSYPGPTHPLAVAAAVQQAGQTISQMAVVLAGRAAVGPTTEATGAPTTEATGATSVPSTAAATEPSALPATEPAAPPPPAPGPPATAPATVPAAETPAPSATPTETPAAPAPDTPAPAPAPAPAPPPPPQPGDVNK